MDCEVRLTRRYDASREEVWAALVDADSAGRWLAPAADTWLSGLREVERGHVLEVDWRRSGEPPSVVRVELVADGSGTTLVLDHRRVAAVLGMRYIGRWTAALARFGERL